MVKRNLFVDISWIDDSFSGGARFSVENILRAIISNKKFNNFNIIFILNNKILEKYKFIKNYEKIFLTNQKYLNFILRWFLLFFLYKKDKSQIYFCTNIYTPIFKLNFKIINLFHDAQWIKFPNNFSLLRKFWIRFNILICKSKSDKIIFTSKSLKKDLAMKFKFTNKVNIIHIPFFKNNLSLKKNYNLKKNSFIICISSRLPHKNLETIEALFLKYKDVIKQKLIIAGLGKDKINKKYKNIKYMQFIDEQKKIWLIKNSKCVLLPSKYEGFGMVAIETVINGGLVIATNLEVYKELIGNNAIYVSSPENIEHWLEKIVNLNKNKNLNNKKVLRKFDHKIISDEYFKCISN